MDLGQAGLLSDGLRVGLGLVVFLCGFRGALLAFLF